ncbi:hypothetical protein [Methylobacterium pseudosasicola]|uniref:Uncharacterized protein n=1 Tax=Methylobacterium pseudosasicola TaxID=582667 RepID=A0A1I4QME3_9HYPH|nr:hypothetical protein [Methylobacterium pseudosasicola]SFM40823.1 hypothetical protein SAMN05192568_103047 [Methylobacterium pseudosasicola]
MNRAAPPVPGPKVRPLALLALLAAAPVAARAEEPLFIRIRPTQDGDRIAREALWARREAHARAVIESVCTGCLGAWKPAADVAPVAPSEPVQGRIADLAAPTGLETDPGSGASGPASDPSLPERQP